MKQKSVTVVIDRRKWCRGVDAGNSGLRLKDGKQCCLGFACRVLGVKAKDILLQPMPSDLLIENLNGLTDQYKDDTVFSIKAAAINDNPAISDKEREKQLKSLAKENGFIFKFTN